MRNLTATDCQALSGSFLSSASHSPSGRFVLLGARRIPVAFQELWKMRLLVFQACPNIDFFYFAADKTLCSILRSVRTTVRKSFPIIDAIVAALRVVIPIQALFPGLYRLKPKDGFLEKRRAIEDDT
jgi:hypothetical protein